LISRNDNPYESELMWKQSMKKESSDYLKSIKAGLDMGLLK